MGDAPGIPATRRGGTTLVLLAARPGDPQDATTVTLPHADRVIAADSGLHLATTLGVRVDLVIGDLDSVDPVILQQALAKGVATDVHPRDKDHTDLALALHEAATTAPREIVVVGGAGGRLDHGVANLMALADPLLSDVTPPDTRIRAWLGGARVEVVRNGTRTLDGTPDGLVSLLAVGGTAHGVTTAGLRWELIGADLPATSTRGISNELLGDTATVTVADGCVLAIQPAAE